MSKLFMIFMSVFPIICFSQDIETNGYVDIICDSRLDTLMARNQEINRRKESIEGYRIQIVAGSNRNAVNKVKGQFYNEFSDKKPYIVYQQPNFKLRVGVYRTRLEAYKDLQKIVSKFSDAFIIRDEIKITEL